MTLASLPLRPYNAPVSFFNANGMAWALLLFWHFLKHPWTRYVAAWVLALGLAYRAQDKAHHSFDSRAGEPDQKKRRDGNNGHVSIDFGGQWLMGRMLVLGQGRHIYDRHRQYEVAQRAYRMDREAPEADQHDADEILGSFMDAEADKDASPYREFRQHRERATLQSFLLPLGAVDPLQGAVCIAVAKENYWTPEAVAELSSKHNGGPLYPPTQAFVFAPLALEDEPQRAYFLVQWLMLLCAFVAGLGVSVLTRGRIWWPVAATMILCYPGYAGGHELGQNGPASLAILVWGWALIARGYEMGGGLVWGLLAFKPVWAAAFLLAPLLTRRWRTCAAMIAVGAAMVAATLPFVGIETWLDWLKVGSVANKTYNVDGHWVPLSRDLLGIPRRFLIDIDNYYAYFGRDRWYAHVAGWALWLFVVETTIRLSQLYPRLFRAATGPAAGFLLLGAWLSCFHFMYYDVVLSAIAYFAILDPPSQIFRRKFVAFGTASGLDQSAIDYFRPRLATTHPGLSGSGTGRTWVANSFLIYFGVVLLIVQFTLPWINLGASITLRHFPAHEVSSAGEVLVRDGKTVKHTPKVEISTGTLGPAWDTYCLLVLWAWCGLRVVLAGTGLASRERQPPEGAKIEDSSC